MDRGRRRRHPHRQRRLAEHEGNDIDLGIFFLHLLKKSVGSIVFDTVTGRFGTLGDFVGGVVG